MHCVQTQKEDIISTQMSRPFDYALEKIKTSPVGLVEQDFTDFICISHIHQVNFIKNIAKGRGNSEIVIA